MRLALALLLALVLWQLPALAIVWLLYVLPAWALGLIEYRGLGYYRGWLPYAVFRPTTTTPAGRLRLWLWLRYARAWGEWGGCGLHHVVITRYEHDLRHMSHEGRHVWQAAVLGVFWGLLYLEELARVGYHDNVLEVDARAHEG